MSPAYSMNYQLVRGDELVELRDRLARAEKFVRMVLSEWQEESYCALEGDQIQEAARASGYQVDVPQGSHADCEWCDDGESGCAELRLPTEEMP